MKTDAQLKADVTNELEWDPSITATNVGVAVKSGVVTLSGHLETFAEKFAIERAVQFVEGVKAVAIVGVSNSITLKAHVTPCNISGRIRDALTRHA